MLNTNDPNSQGSKQNPIKEKISQVKLAVKTGILPNFSAKSKVIIAIIIAIIVGFIVIKIV